MAEFNFNMSACSICPRRCNAHRPATGKGEGFCTLPSLPGICRAAKHMWEEPDISGTNGSGAVFFSGCVLRCEFCQNSEISRASCGKSTSADGLIEIIKGLESQGVHNINLVSPTPYWHIISQALGKYKPSVPVIANTSGYERVETLRALEGLIDIYLPDYKYSVSDVAKKYSAAADYPQVAAKAIVEMNRQVGSPVHDENGMMTRGLMVRHLVLPGNVESSYGVLDFIADCLPRETYVSLMAQYFPTGNETHAELNRRITKEEYELVSGYMLLLGLDNGYVQELDSADKGYIPVWDMK